MIIDTPEALLHYLTAHDLTPDQFNQVVSASVGCYVDTTLSKDERIDKVKQYLNQWKNTPHQDRPLFAF
jgi:hypothetical protein